MTRSPARTLAAAALAALATGAVRAQNADYAIDFQRDIRPILARHCFACHGPDPAHRKAGLRLDRREAAVAARDDGAAIVPGDPTGSVLLQRIASTDPRRVMPPPDAHRPLLPAQIEQLRDWIAAGAEYAAHWAYTPPAEHPLPAIADADWPRNAIDHWVLAALEARGRTPAPPADRATLLRRLSLDLTGLPPTAEEVRAFLDDRRADAYEQWVEQLLASPRHGERMATFWFDLVRYADTVGYHGDQEHAIAPYRDWVIAAFNRNIPFDQFTVQQLAGDLLPEPTQEQRVATGYNRLLQTTHEGGAQAGEYLAIYAADRVRNLGLAWLGSTVGCAQCHDHKYDPFTQRDFYELAAFFADVEEKGDFAGSPNTTPTTRPPEMRVHSDADRQLLAAIDTELARATERDPASAEPLRAQRAAIEERGVRTMITRACAPRAVRVLPRGDWMDDSGAEVQPAVPAFLGVPLDAADRRATRLDLARWLVHPRNPLTARTLVNRLWAMLMGRGLARVDDLGVQGDAPSHPELLDSLALELVRSGWDVRHVLRLIVRSSTYRQSSDTPAGNTADDPDNVWLGRQARWRLAAEFVRDQALFAAGLLQLTDGGAAVRPYQPAGYYRHLNFPKRRYAADDSAQQWRRGVYVHWQRQFLHPQLRNFDAPSREDGVAARPRSNTPQQALTLLNDPTFVEAARALAARVATEATSDRSRLEAAVGHVLSRAARDDEVDALLAFLRRQRAHYAATPGAARALLSVGIARRPAAVADDELAAWTATCRVLLNLPEAITRH